MSVWTIFQQQYNYVSLRVRLSTILYGCHLEKMNTERYTTAGEKPLICEGKGKSENVLNY